MESQCPVQPLKSGRKAEKFVLVKTAARGKRNKAEGKRAESSKADFQVSSTAKKH